MALLPHLVNSVMRSDLVRTIIICTILLLTAFYTPVMVDDTDAASTRALIPAGNKGGANIVPNDGDTLAGKYWNINIFEIQAGRTVSIVAGSVVIIKAKHIWINGTLSGNGAGVTGGSAGGVGTDGGPGGGSATNGNGTGGGNATTFGGGGGGGGGYGNIGGLGGNGGGASGGAGGAGGTAFRNAKLMNIDMGRGGGGGGGGGEAGLGGAGGAGGGGVWLQATHNMGIIGTITMNGAVGSTPADPGGGGGERDAGGGGGGGSGGGILIKLDSFTNSLTISGTLQANGGNGGNGATGGKNGADGGGGGGGGSGGRIKVFYNSTFTNSSTMTATPGNGGNAGLTGGGAGLDGYSGNPGFGGSIYVSHMQPPRLSIDSTETYRWPTMTSNFYSGQSVLIKATMNHTWGQSQITSSVISIYNPSNAAVVNSQAMTFDGSGLMWKRYRYTYSFPIPSPRGPYRVNITATGTSDTDYAQFYINVLNQAPQITGTVGPFSANEDGSIPTKALGSQKTDLEDSGASLTWSVNPNDLAFVTLGITNDDLSFTLKPDQFGSAQVNLTLTDSDGGKDWVWFWVTVIGQNDLPYIDPVLPHQEKPEDSPEWLLDLSAYENDVEDGGGLPSPLLNWTVSGAGYPLDVAKVYIDTTDKLHLAPLPNAYGTSFITLNLTDSANSTVSQQIYVNITPVNDPPILDPIPDVNMTSTIMDDVYDLTTYASDIDSTTLNYKIESVSDTRFSVTIDASVKLDISVPDNIISSAVVNLSVNDGEAFSYTEFSIFAHFGQLETELVQPQDDAHISSQAPKLQWNTLNPGSLANVVYDVYLGINLAQVADHDKTVLRGANITVEEYSASSLHNGTTYYWTVVPKARDIGFTGSCISGVWKFTVDVSIPNQAPSVELISPHNNATVKTRTVELIWKGQDPNGDSPLYYSVYLDTDKSKVMAHDSSVRRANDLVAKRYITAELEEDTQYFWTVIPRDFELNGTSKNGTWQFYVNSENDIPVVTLIYPDENEFVGSNIMLIWTYVDNDFFDTVTFDIYLDIDRSKVENKSGEVRLTADDYSQLSYDVSNLQNGERYYWWVIPYDGTEFGICESGVWHFNVNASIVNKPPITTLESPKDGTKIYTGNAKLEWSGYDPDDDPIIFTVYFDTDRVKVENLNEDVKIAGIFSEDYSLERLDSGTYYWTVIPSDAESVGFCKSGVWTLIVDLQDDDTDGDSMPDYWEELYGLDIHVDDASLDKDGDGFSNLAEYIGGTDPTDENSHPPDVIVPPDDNETKDDSDLRTAVLAISAIILILVLVLLFFFVTRRKEARRRAERAAAESAELVRSAEEAEGPYLGDYEDQELPDEKPYEEPEPEPDLDEEDFAIEKSGYRPPGAAPKAGAVTAAAVGAPVPAVKKEPGADEEEEVVEEDSGVVDEPEKEAVLGKFQKHLSVNKEVANKLYEAGFSSVALLKKASMEDLMKVDGLSLEKASRLRLAVVNLPPDAPVAETPKALPTPTPKPVPTPTPTPVPKPAAAAVPTPTPKPVPTPVPSVAAAVPKPAEVEAKEEKKADTTCSSCGFPLDETDKICPICETARD